MSERDDALGSAVREAGGRIVAALAARFRDLDIAEDAFAFACAKAVEAAGPAPRNYAGWLYAVALRRAYDLGRRARVRAAWRPPEPEPGPTPEDLVVAAFEPIPDERLRLIFTCCHPALAADARITLTLRVICDLSVERLARAFLTTETAMIQRLTRAKAKIRAARIPFEVPEPAAWPERITAVLGALEVAYAQAYEDAAGTGDAAGLAGETLRLSGLLTTLMPDEPEVLGLAATIRLAEARWPARIDASGRMIPLDKQDIGLWDDRLIGEAVDLLRRAATLGRTGPHQILATIHATHCARAETGRTDWAIIATLYDALAHLRPNAATAVNRAVAIGHAVGPEAGLTELKKVEGMATWLPYQAALAALSAQAGRPGDAATAYAAALTLDPAPAERLYLEGMLRDAASA
jgi:RNA polymerase sigma-70 factor, ECF subfamily